METSGVFLPNRSGTADKTVSSIRGGLFCVSMFITLIRHTQSKYIGFRQAD